MLKACFIGHRPDKLGGYNWASKENVKILKKLLEVSEQLIVDKGVTTFYFGGALGIDQMSFEIVKRYKIQGWNNIKLILALPYKNQSKIWSQEDIKRYESQKRFADKVVYVDELKTYAFEYVPIGEHHNAKLQIRNQYMIDNSDIVIAFWDGTSGGTANGYKYAQKKNKQIILINPKDIIGE